MVHAENLVHKDQFARLLGIEVLDAAEGQATLKMAVRSDHLNGIGIVQGGAIFTLADTAFAAACNSRGVVTVAIHADISFLKAATGPILFAQATEVKNAKVGAYEVRITQGAAPKTAELVAIFHGVSYQKTALTGSAGR